MIARVAEGLKAALNWRVPPLKLMGLVEEPRSASALTVTVPWLMFRPPERPALLPLRVRSPGPKRVRPSVPVIFAEMVGFPLLE